MPSKLSSYVDLVVLTFSTIGFLFGAVERDSFTLVVFGSIGLLLAWHHIELGGDGDGDGRDRPDDRED